MDAAARPAAGLGLVPASGVSLGAFFLFALEIGWIGYAVLALSLLVAWRLDADLARDLLLISIGLTIVSTVSVRADIRWERYFLMGTTLALAVAVPFVIDRFALGRRAITFPWRTHRPWERWQLAYLVAVPVLAWLILPFYFIHSGAYRNWPVIREPSEYVRFFVGVNAVGTWDELFFVCTCFALLLRHFPLWQANLLQAVIFVSFLWELGYSAWGPLLTIPFALVQGYLFGRTSSLAYVVTVHLIFDAVVFLAIVHAHDRSFFPFFVY